MAEKYSKLDRVMDDDLFILDCISKFAFMDLQFIIMKIKLPLFSFFGQALRETTAFHQMTKF